MIIYFYTLYNGCEIHSYLCSLSKVIKKLQSMIANILFNIVLYKSKRKYNEVRD